MGKENVVKFKKGKMTPRFGSEKYEDNLGY